MLPDWLPNVHPIVVHFPIALLYAAVLVDAIALLRRRTAWLRVMAVSLYVLGGVAAVASFVTGHQASEGLRQLPSDVLSAVHEHEEWGERTAWFFGILAPVRLVTEWRDRRPRWALRILLLFVGVVGLIFLYETGEHGGMLVFKHGLGVAASHAAAP